ncbi:MAG: DUF3122 domain-containing protein [Elainellaceae cyanobacterium]
MSTARLTWTKLLLTSALALCLMLTSVLPAQARLMEETLASGELLHKSLRSLQDNHGYSWQLIAFKTESEPLAYLRLVGFPAIPSIDHQAPLLVQAAGTQIGVQIAVPDQTPRFGAAAPPPTVAQYPLASILNPLSRPAAVTLFIPNRPSRRDSPSELHIPKSIVREWQAILKCELETCSFDRA